MTEIRFIPHDIFTSPDASAQIEARKPTAAPLAKEASPSRTSPLGKLCERRLLTREEEHYLFLRMNYEKFLARHAAEEQAAGHLTTAEELRDQILAGNYRLLVSLAGRYSTPEQSAEELVSEGILPLMQAVEMFDVSRGWAFGTYATHVLKNHFRRLGQRRQRKNRLLGGVSDSLLQHVRDMTVPASQQETLAMHAQRMVRRLFGELCETDREILKARFGFDDPAYPKLRSYAEVGRSVGLSKERVRVRAHRAIEKLQETAREHRWEFPELDTLSV